MYVYDGAVWIPASAASSAILVVYQYTATAGQTTFSGSDNNALTLAYTAGSAIVTLNGVILEVPSEVTASSGSSVVLGVAASAGDELNVYAFATFDIANTYTQAQVDAFAVKLTGAQTVAGVKTFSSQPVFSAGIDLSSNGQIKFPASQNASADANTLDDYEEGNWTPNIASQTGTITSYTSNGQYTKIGRNVFLTFTTTLTNVGTASGRIQFSNLPFLAIDLSGGRPAMVVGRENAATGIPVVGWLDGNQTTGEAASLSFTAITWTNNYQYTFSVTYQTST
jgi:hypothetical protein